MKPIRVSVVASLLLFSLFPVVGCGKDANHKPVGDKECPSRIALSSDQIAATGNHEYFADGRIVITGSDGWTKRTVKVSPERMAKLDRDLAKVLLNEKDGCWMRNPSWESSMIWSFA